MDSKDRLREVGQILSNAVGYVVRRWAEDHHYTFPIAIKALVAGCDDPAVADFLKEMGAQVREELAKLEASN